MALPWDYCGVILETAAAQCRREWRRDPGVQRLDRLAVEVRVKKQRPRRAWRAEFAVHIDRRAWGFDHARTYATPLQHRDEHISVAANIVGVSGDVRERQQLTQLADDGFLVCGDMLARGRHRAGHRERRRRCFGV
ncbi:MAG: hypothetical protein AB7P07_10530 [Hyphomonadaceae bacterium]